MSTKKSIVEQALLQVQTLEEAVKANAKGILSSTMKNELNGLLEEMEEEEVTENVPVVKPEDVAEQTADEEDVKPEEEEEVSDEEDATDEEGVNPEEEADDFSDEEASDEEDLESPSTDEFGAEGDEESDEDDEDVLDMTGASDDEVLKVFKAMKSEDGIVVKRDGNTIEFQDGDNDYVIKLGDDEGDELANVAEGCDEEEMSDEDIYEIELSDEEEEEMGDMKEGKNSPFDKSTKKEFKEGTNSPFDKSGKTKKEFKEEEMTDEEETSTEEEFTESARTKGFGYHGGLKSKKIFKSGNKREEINEEVERLKKQNAEYKEALGLFKEKLNEVAVFNANLAYATRLFTEHTTTKQEKLEILQRFDTISTITESKKLYNSIKGELDNKKPMTETVANKIVSSPKTSTTEILAESKAYENPQFSRMRDLMKKIK